MRDRMRTELSKSGSGEFDLKQDRGGLADIEFLVDFWVLENSGEYPELVEFPDNVRQLEALARAGLVSADRCNKLKSIYLRLRERSHLLALNDDSRIVDEAEYADESRYVASVWNEVFGE